MTDNSAAHTPGSSAAEPHRPLRILIGADTFPPEINGSANFSARLASQLVKRGHDVHVVAPAASRKHGTFTEVIEGESMTVHRLPSLRWYPHPWLRFAIPFGIQKRSARVLDEVKPDVVHFQSHIVTGRGLAKQAHDRGIRLIGTNHVMPENLIDHSPIPQFMAGWAARRFWNDASRWYGLAEVLTSPTRRAADWFQEAIKVKGILAISCGVDMARFTPHTARPAGNLIVFVGRITGEKRLEVLVRAFAQLDPALDARLELVGGGEEEQHLATLARSLGVGDRVTITGYVSDEQLKDGLARATVFAMPSIAELQSIATMEAMSNGLPVVGADAMALPHLVHDGENGYLFEPDNVEDLASRLTDVLTASDEDYMAMARESLRIVEAHDIQKTVSTFEAIYRGEHVTDTIKEPIQERTLRSSLAKVRERTQSVRDKLSRSTD